MHTFHVSIDIMLRKSILDVQGKTVEQSLHAIGFEHMNGVRIGKRVELEIQAESEEAARKQLGDACEALIANPIMEDYSIHLQKAETQSPAEAQ